MLDLLSTPGPTYCKLGFGLCRIYNQAWFTWIDVDGEPDDSDDTLLVSTEPTLTPKGPRRSSIRSRNVCRVRLKSLMVDVKGLEPLTFRV